MLVIKQKQIDLFIAEDDTQLNRVISDIIREAFTEGLENYSDETVKSMAKIGIKRAKSHGFQRPADIAAFVAVMLEISPNFDTNEQVKFVLEDENIPTEQKFQYLFGRIPDEIWAEMESNYNAEIWFPENRADGE